MKHLAISILLLCACDQKTDSPSRTMNCLDYATALLGMCLDAVGTEDSENMQQCDEQILEAGYNACNLALESDMTVCVPYRDRFGAERYHACSGYVYPPAPTNWRGPKEDATGAVP